MEHKADKYKKKIFINEKSIVYIITIEIEDWILTEEQESKIQVTQIKYIRSMQWKKHQGIENSKENSKNEVICWTSIKTIERATLEKQRTADQRDCSIAWY